ncbi:tetratricopeptide repeat protein [Siphonobacter sp.]|uniref:tetratricopeptide repeat protein n=1 Tax=Siphonobacter sp. TaxID=1869184 RepID=UPI003B3B968D
MIFRFLPLLLLLLECLTGMAQSQNDSWLQAQEQIRRGEYVQSIPVLQKILETDSTQVEAALQLGFVQQRLGQLPAARKTYETILRRDTSQTEALNQLAILSEKNAQYRRALHYYQRLIQLDTTNAYLFKQAAVQYSRLEQLGQAIAFYNKAVALNPQDIESWGELTRIHLDLNDAAHLKLAGECVEKGLTIDPNSIRLLLQNSRVDFRLGRFAEVVTSLQKTMAQGDSSAFYQRMLGRAYYEIDSLDQSIFTFRRLLNAGEETEYVYGGLGTAYLLKAKKDSAHFDLNAFRNFKQAIQLAQTRVPDYQMGLGDVYELEGKPASIKRAIKIYQETFNLSERPKALYRLAQLHDTYQVDMELAKTYYQELIKTCKVIASNPRNARPMEMLDCAYATLAANRLAELHKLTPNATAPLAQDSVQVVADTTKND